MVKYPCEIKPEIAPKVEDDWVCSKCKYNSLCETIALIKTMEAK